MQNQLEPIQVTPQQNRNIQLALKVVSFPFQTMRAIAALILIVFVLATIAYYPIPSVLVGAGAAFLYIKRKTIFKA